MSTELLATLFAGLTALVAALGTYTANRQRRINLDQKLMRKQFRTLQRQLVATLGHVFELEIRMASAGLPVPERPAILEDLTDDDDPAADSVAQAKRPAPSDGNDRTRSP